MEEDPNYKLDDETLQTLLVKIIPNDLVKPMRELLTQERYVNDYHGFEQALFDEISTRKMDEDARKGSPGIHAVGNTTEVPAQEDASPDLYQNDIEYETVQIWSEEWQCHISGLAPRKRDRSRSRSRGRDEGEQHSKDKGPSDESQKVGKGSKGRGRPGGPCWTCGGPHFQRECLHASASKGNYPITTAWSSWRPGTFPGPSAAQWNSWLPKPKGKGKGKGKNKGGKGDFKGKGKGHVNEMLNFWGSPLGQVQDSWSCAHASHSENWDPDSDLNSLLPICALSSPSTKTSEPDSWTYVKTRNHGHWRSNQLESQSDSLSKTNQITRSRFAVLADDMDKSFQVFNAEQKQDVPKPRMSVFPKGVSQAASKSAVRKKNKEQKSLLIAPVNEGVSDPEFTRRANELRQEC